MVMFRIKLKRNMYSLTSKPKNNDLSHTPWPLGMVEMSDIDIVDRLLIIICKIPKVNFQAGEMGFTFCNLYLSLK